MIKEEATVSGSKKQFCLDHSCGFTAPLLTTDQRVPVDFKPALMEEELAEIKNLAKFSLPPFKLHDILSRT